jgi:hypothetical protein
MTVCEPVSFAALSHQNLDAGERETELRLPRNLKKENGLNYKTSWPRFVEWQFPPFPPYFPALSWPGGVLVRSEAKAGVSAFTAQISLFCL